MFIKDRQATIHMQADLSLDRFFFEKNDLDTVKICSGDKKSYVHFFDGKVEEYATKKALRGALCRESGGAWIEENEGKKRYFTEEKGRLWSSYKEVSEEEFLQKEDASSTLQKILGFGLGLLALSPGILETVRQIPFRMREVSTGFLALHQKNPYLGALSCVPFLFERASAEEFLVNSYTENSQSGSKIAGLQDGGFVIVWTSSGQDGSSSGVYGQRYFANGTRAGSEFQVNTYTDSSQGSPSVAGLADGGFIVTWMSLLQDGNSQGVYAQQYDEFGLRRGNEFRVNTRTSGSEETPSVASLIGGGFMITWTATTYDGDMRGIFAQRYDSSGNPIGGEFQVNSYITGSQQFSRAAGLSDGGFVITWRSYIQDGGTSGAYGQRFNSNGVKSGSEFRANSYTANTQSGSDVASLVGGGFVIAWESFLQDGDSSGVYAQRYDSNGANLGNEFRVNSYTVSSQGDAALTGLAGGDFVIVWDSNGQDGDDSGIFAQRYFPNGTSLGPEFQVNINGTLRQNFPSIASLLDGGFVIVWTQEDPNTFGIEDVYGRRYNANGRDVNLTISITSSSIVQQTRSSYSTFESQIVSSETASSQLTTESQIVNSETASSQPISESQTVTSEYTTSGSQSSDTDSGTFGSSSPGSTSQLNIHYGDIYEISLNGATIGTFYITGGEGPYSTSNSNTLVVDLNSLFIPEDGEIVVLFTDLPQDQVLELDNIEFVNGSECFTAEGVFIEDETNGNSYGLLFDTSSDSCELAIEANRLVPLAALIATN